MLDVLTGCCVQVERKRHVGNDIVMIVYQEGDTPFTPSLIASQFLHAFIVVRPIDADDPHTAYRVAVTARGDVPRFGPDSQEVVTRDNIREFMLSLLISAEHASYEGAKISKIHVRTRYS